MKYRPEKYYDKDDMNHHCFFQPISFRSIPKETLKAEKQIDSLPSPMDRYRVSRPRLVPRGYK